MPKVTLSEIEATVKSALERHGASPWIAAEVARAVRKAEAVGNLICGLYYLESYCKQLQNGRVKGDVEPVVTRPRPGAVRVDARFGFAQPAFARAMPEAVAAARDCGVASLAVGHAHTCTSLGFFTEQIALEGLIGLGMTNASPIVAPPGGKTRVIGTNPIAFSVPDGKGGLAMQFDQSTTTVALGKITMAKAAGEHIPEGWAVDIKGEPTTDPHRPHLARRALGPVFRGPVARHRILPDGDHESLRVVRGALVLDLEHEVGVLQRLSHGELVIHPRVGRAAASFDLPNRERVDVAFGGCTELALSGCQRRIGDE